MTRTITTFSLALLICAGAWADTTNTTLTVDSTVTLASGTTVSATGTATLSGIGSGSFSASGGLTNIDSNLNVSVPFTITISGASGGTLTGTLKFPVSALTSASSVSGSATITGGTGSFAGATGSFASVTGTTTGSIVTGISLKFSGAGTITTGGGGGTTGPPPPTITAVLDGASYSTNVAEGGLFIVKGSNLAPSGLNQASFPLTTSLNNVKITFTPKAGGTGVDAYMIYTCNTDTYGCTGDKTQLAARVPSTLAVGAYNLTVTNAGVASAAFSTSVVQRKPTLITRDSSGSGLAVIQNFTSATSYLVDSYTTVNPGTAPVAPGATLVAWATGFGPTSEPDNSASAGYDFNANGVSVKVLVGGMSITPLYAGRAPGLAGADQINFILPSNVPTGCTVSLQVSVDGQLSNSTFIAIAPNAAAAACVAPGFTATQLQGLDQGKSFTLGSFYIYQSSQTLPVVGTVNSTAVGGEFAQISGYQLASATGSSSPTAAVLPTNGCQVTTSSGTIDLTQTGPTPTPTPTPTPASPVTISTLDAGAITLSGPSGSGLTNTPLTKTASNLYSLSLNSALPGSVTVNLVPGAYTLTGAGGNDVGAFNASTNLSPLNFAGGLPTVITRSAGLPLTWTPGDPSSLVYIIGTAETLTKNTTSYTYNEGTFYCVTNAGAGSFTVPADILNQLPAVPASAASTGAGATLLEVVSTGSLTPTAGNGLFTAPLKAGGSIDIGVFSGSFILAGTPAFQ